MLERVKRVPWSVWGPRLRNLAVAGGFIASIWILIESLNFHYRIDRWLFWHYAQAWLLALAFLASATSAGFAVLKLGRVRLPLFEQLVFSNAVGVLVFALAIFAGGMFGWFGLAFAIVMPIVVFAPGAWWLFCYLRRAARHLRHARTRATLASGWERVVVVIGIVGLTMVYVTILTPENAAHDSRWYHLAIPEHYAAAGGIVRFPEGWFQGTLPQLTSWLYVWPYQMPIGGFDKLIVAAHLEFVIFLCTIAQVPVVVRWLIGKTGSRRTPLATWAAIFLFSSVFVYDATLTLAADHVAAFWALPMLLALRRAWPELALRESVLLGVVCAGAALTKYQSMQLLIVVFGAVGLRAAMLLGGALWRKLRKRELGFSHRFWLGPLAMAVAFVVLFAPHWVKNWIWHTDPLYPVLHKHITGNPWHQDSNHFYAALVERHFWRPVGTPWDKAKATFEALFKFSFHPHDWAHFHGQWPVFGFLFTLSWPVMPFLKGSRRLWWLFLATHLSITIWFLFSHQDRYLQIIMPWMVAHVAAFILLAWRHGWLARVPLLGLLLLQLVWGFGAYFIPSHAFNRARLHTVAELLSSGYRKDYKARFETFKEFRDIGRSIPKGSKPILHRIEKHAGLHTMSVSDHPSWQALISYGRLQSHRELYDILRGIDVTHAIWRDADTLAEDSLAGDLRFFGFVTHVLQNERRSGSLFYAELPAEAPPENIGENVLYLGCTGYAPGLYDLRQMTVPGMLVPPGTVYPPPTEPMTDPAGTLALLARANYLVTDPRCPGMPAVPTTDFVKRSVRRSEQLFVRMRPLTN